MMLSVVWRRIVVPGQLSNVQYMYCIKYYNITKINLCHSKSYVFYFFCATQMELNKGWANGDFTVQFGYSSACWCYILSFIVRYIGTYNETLKGRLESYTELEWKSVQTSLVSFYQHLNGRASLVFVWWEFTHGQVWSSLGAVTASCKEYTHSTACFTLVLTLCNRIINISCVYCCLLHYYGYHHFFNCKICLSSCSRRSKYNLAARKSCLILRNAMKQVWPLRLAIQA